jgi:hypothetical protein
MLSELSDIQLRKYLGIMSRGWHSGIKAIAPGNELSWKCPGHVPDMSRHKPEVHKISQDDIVA